MGVLDFVSCLSKTEVAHLILFQIVVIGVFYFFANRRLKKVQLREGKDLLLQLAEWEEDAKLAEQEGSPRAAKRLRTRIAGLEKKYQDILMLAREKSEGGH